MFGCACEIHCKENPPILIMDSAGSQLKQVPSTGPNVTATDVEKCQDKSTNQHQQVCSHLFSINSITVTCTFSPLDMSLFTSSQVSVYCVLFCL